MSSKDHKILTISSSHSPHSKSTTQIPQISTNNQQMQTIIASSPLSPPVVQTTPKLHHLLLFSPSLHISNSKPQKTSPPPAITFSAVQPLYHFQASIFAMYATY
ncbi:hypothetical protein A4A49_39182 [Nicotiana attenuata]|nr:hypothetical protein A4A49_39182 [Nicotiana attenuata]